ncbi:cytochrome ubiquinol oxidase subunit I [candidate division KSB1 bacterium]
MGLDVELLSRIQFAITIGFHFLFPPISIGLAWLLVFVEWRSWKKNDKTFEKIGRFFGKLLALTFVVGVATGIVMEFQFGMNWAKYSEFVGDIFGAPLAAEGVFAFFLESSFLGLYLFGRKRVSRGVHWFSIFMVAFGATISAFWIIVANSWQQTPAGFIIQNGRAELTDFWAAVFNASTHHRFFHTMVSCFIAGSFFMAGISAYLFLKNKGSEAAKKALKLSIITGLIFSVLVVFPTGHEHAKQVAETQPSKFATMEGLVETTEGAPLVLFGIPLNKPPSLKLPIEIHALLSYMVYGNFDAEITGMEEFPESELPPMFLTFVSFHNMVILGMIFILLTSWGTFLIYRNKLFESCRFLKMLIWATPLPLIAIQFGWVTAEVGRQPWIVFGLLKTSEAFSPTVPAGQVLFSMIMYCIIYLLLGSLYIFLLKKEVNHGFEQ